MKSAHWDTRVPRIPGKASLAAKMIATAGSEPLLAAEGWPADLATAGADR
jgi:hypothetical protein